MLTIGKLGIGQERYYLDKVAEGAEDYYSGEGEVAGEWLGDAAETALGRGRAAQLERADRAEPGGGEPLLGGTPSRKGGVPASTSLLSSQGVSCWGSAVPSPRRGLGCPPRRSTAPRYLSASGWTRRAQGIGFVQGNGYWPQATPSLLAQRRSALHTHVY